MKLQELTSGISINIIKYNIINELNELLSKILNINIAINPLLIKQPPPKVKGDIAIPCFQFSKKLKKSPQEIANLIAQKFEPTKNIAHANSEGPYCNFDLIKNYLAVDVINNILNETKSYGYSKVGQDKRVMIEYSSPNTNKPQHLGHIRNNLLGHVCANMLSAIGFKVFKTSIVNDRGIHICKSMLAYNKWGNGKTPKDEKIKADHFVGNYYVKFENELRKEREQYYKKNNINIKDKDKRDIESNFLAQSPLMKAAQEMLRKWESGNETVVNLWKKMNEWVLTGFNITYQKLGVDFDKTYYESDIYLGGKDIIEEALAAGKFTKRPDKSIVAELSKTTKYPDKTVLRADGTGLYVTQDINLAKIKFNDFQLDYSIYCIASEQDLYMQQLFAILKIIGFDFADNMYHLSYGMVNLPEGKMKSREGTVVDADELIEKMTELAKHQLKTRSIKSDKNEIRKKSKIIGDSALKYYILHFSKNAEIHFDPKKSISLEGITGPYIQYTYARISSILKKIKKDIKMPESINFSIVAEWPIVNILIDFPEIVYRSAINCEPSILAGYLYNLAKKFNSYYHQHSVIKSDGDELMFKICMLKSVQQVILNGLKLMDIETLEEM